MIFRDECRSPSPTAAEETAGGACRAGKHPDPPLVCPTRRMRVAVKGRVACNSATLRGSHPRRPTLRMVRRRAGHRNWKRAAGSAGRPGICAGVADRVGCAVTAALVVGSSPERIAVRQLASCAEAPQSGRASLRQLGLGRGGSADGAGGGRWRGRRRWRWRLRCRRCRFLRCL